LSDRLAPFVPGTTLTFCIVRRGASERVSVTLGIDPTQLWSLAQVPSPTRDQLVHLKIWLQD
jgi:hypothetical protein